MCRPLISVEVYQMNKLVKSPLKKLCDNKEGVGPTN